MIGITFLPYYLNLVLQLQVFQKLDALNNIFTKILERAKCLPSSLTATVMIIKPLNGQYNRKIITLCWYSLLSSFQEGHNTINQCQQSFAPKRK